MPSLLKQHHYLSYIFVSCSHVKRFWSKFTYWWNTKKDDSTVLNEKMLPTVLRTTSRLVWRVNFETILKYHIQIMLLFVHTTTRKKL